jgi:hypothetical protein
VPEEQPATSKKLPVKKLVGILNCIRDRKGFAPRIDGFVDSLVFRLEPSLDILCYFGACHTRIQNH